MNERIKIKIPEAEEFFETMNPKKDDIKIEFLGRIVTIIIAGLGLITALAWDEAFRDIFVKLFGNLNSFNDKLGYAIFVTGIAVVGSIILGRIFIKKKRKAKHD